MRPHSSNYVTPSNSAADIILLDDSNGKFIDINKFSPHKSVRHIFSPTFTSVIQTFNASPYFDPEIFTDLERDISFFQSNAFIVLAGDLNARTGTEIDSVPETNSKYIPGDR